MHGTASLDKRGEFVGSELKVRFGPIQIFVKRIGK